MKVLSLFGAGAPIDIELWGREPISLSTKRRSDRHPSRAKDSRSRAGPLPDCVIRCLSAGYFRGRERPFIRFEDPPASRRDSSIRV